MARTKKSRTMRGKLGKTGSKEQMKEQKKAQKSKSIRRFQTKKSNQRKDQAQKKLERLGLAPAVEEAVNPPRARRFTFVSKTVEKEEEQVIETAISNELSMSDLVDAFTEAE